MPRLRYLWLVALVVIGAGALAWALAPEWFGSPPAERTAKLRSADEAIAPSGPRVAEALALAGDRGTGAVQRIVDSYRDWAGDPASAGARRLLLGRLFEEPNVPLKLSGVLAAIEADPTPPEQDPLWSHLVDRLSEVWKGDTATSGMDLMFAERRPRARRALIASFAHLVNTDRFRELSPQQGQKLVEYFIDMHKELSPGQKPEVEQALRKVVGNDAVDILNGKGLGEDDHVLESERAYRTSLANTRRALDEDPASLVDPSGEDGD